MPDFPAEIWQMIIEYAYPINIGWNNRLWHLAKISKMHYNLVKYIFSQYKKLPIFPKHPKNDFLSETAVIKYITKNFPEIPSGFIIYYYSYNPTNNKNFISIRFSFTNILDQNISFTKNIRPHRYLIAKSYVYDQGYSNPGKSKRGKRWKNGQRSSENIKHPIIIVPFDDGCYVFFVGCQQTGNLTIYNKWYFDTIKDDLKYISHQSMLHMIRYVMDNDNPIPNNADSFIMRAEEYYDRHRSIEIL